MSRSRGALVKSLFNKPQSTDHNVFVILSFLLEHSGTLQISVAWLVLAAPQRHVVAPGRSLSTSPNDQVQARIQGLLDMRQLVASKIGSSIGS